MYKIEKDIPMPEGKYRYPFSNMEVGDSFFVEGKEPYKVASSAYQYSRKQSPKTKYIVRAQGTGARIWRIA